MEQIKWQSEGACLGMDPAIFFAPGENTKSSRPRPAHKIAEFYDAPRKICNSCPVQAECLAHALRNNEPSGMWGGATPMERREMRKRQVA